MDRSLHAETIESRSEDIVVIKTVDQKRIERDFICDRAINNSLVQIGCAQSPDSAAEGNVVAVVNFGKMIERPWLFRKGKNIFAPIVLNANESFLDIDIRCAVFSHGAQLHQVTLGLEFFNGKKHM